jgi:hypothetical protein
MGVFFLEVASAKGVIIINGRAYDAQRILSALLGNSYVDMRIEGPSLIIGGTRIQPVSRGAQDLAMLRTCHGSLAYCCSPEKRCVDRDGALELLGLTMEDYQRIKSACHQIFIDAAKRLIDTASLKNAVWTYQATTETDEINRADSSSSRQVDSNLPFRGSSRPYIENNDSSEPSSSGSKSYGPIDLSLIFGEPSTRSSSTYLGEGNRKEKSSSNWNPSGNTPLTFDNRGEGREEEEEGMARCIHCRAELPLRARFCPNCGESVA